MKTRQRSAPKGLWSYSATAGSVSVLLGGLASLPFPNPWALAVWAVVSIALCTGAGLAAGRFFE